MKRFFLYLGIFTLFSCQNDLTTTVNDKIKVINHVVSSSAEFYQFYRIRNSSFEVSRIPYDKDKAIISISPEPIIEKNFSHGTPIDLLIVKEFAKLNCIYLYFNKDFVRTDFFIPQKGAIKALSKKTKIIIFKGNPPKNQKFISDKNKVVEYDREWKYLIIEP